MRHLLFVVLLTLIPISTLALPSNILEVKAEFTGTIYIKADGSIDPPNAPIRREGNLYILTDNINSDYFGIIIERDNITIDGAGYAIVGSKIARNKEAHGIYAYNRRNITIKNITVTNFYWGISLIRSFNSTLAHNRIMENTNGLFVSYGYVVTKNKIICNNITSNSWIGAIFYYSNGNIFCHNNLTNNYQSIYLEAASSNIVNQNYIARSNLFGIQLYRSTKNNISKNYIESINRNGIELIDSSKNFVLENNLSSCGISINNAYENIFEGNTFNSKPIIYLENAANVIIDEQVGQVILLNCSNIIVKNQEISLNEYILFKTKTLIILNTKYVTIINCSKISLGIINSSNITVKYSNLSGSIVFENSRNNTLAYNDIASGIFLLQLYNSYNNKIIHNNIWDAVCAVYLKNSSNNLLAYNSLKGIYNGTYLINSPNNDIVHNNIICKKIGVYLKNSKNNLIAYNNLQGNMYAVYLVNSPNINIDNNNIENSQFAIYLSNASYSNVTHNSLKSYDYGVYLENSKNNLIAYNNITGSCYGVYLVNSPKNNITLNNLNILEMPAICVNGSSNTLITHNNITARRGWAIDFKTCLNNITITYNKIYAYYGVYGEIYNSTIAYNHITWAIWGVWVSGSNLKISHNKILAIYGIFGSDVHNSSILHNYIEGKDIGILVGSYNVISYNTIFNSTSVYGVVIGAGNIFSCNNVINNRVGLYLASSNNSIYHNNFVNNTPHVFIENEVTNVWDDGYPSGGNYWSDYAGIDKYQGPFQNETGCDNIGDTPYVIDAKNQDRYPLMFPIQCDKPPTIPSVILPSGGEVLRGIHKITWTASTDPDGDPITYQLQYSDDGGSSWHDLADDISETYYFWNTSSSPDGSNYLVRVRAYDGKLYSKWDRSDRTFTVDNTPPTVQITHPSDGAEMLGANIWVNGTITEPNMGMLKPNINDTRFSLSFWDYSSGTFAFKNNTLISGRVSVTILFTDLAGNTGSDVVSFTVPVNAPPEASFTYSPANPMVNEPLTFNASSSYDPDGKIVAYNWKFGDGTESSGNIVNHTYAAPGTYTVTLKVEDNRGALSEARLNVTVFAAKIIVGSLTLSRGERGLIPVIAYARNLGAYNLNVTFNPNILNVTGVLGGKAPFNSPVWRVDKRGYVLLNQFISATEEPSGNITLAYLNVTAIGEPGESTTLPVNIVSLVDASTGDEIRPRMGIPGNVTISTIPSVEVSLNVTVDDEGYVCVEVMFNSTADLKGGLGAFTLNLTLLSDLDRPGLDVLSGMSGRGFDAKPIMKMIGRQIRVVSFAREARAPQLRRLSVSLLRLRLTGPAGGKIHMKPASLLLVEATSGRKFKAAVHGTSLRFIRGDANGDGRVSIADAMFIAQYLAGNRPLSKIKLLNAASVKHDGEKGDKITIADAMFIAQHLAALRDEYFKLKGK